LGAEALAAQAQTHLLLAAELKALIPYLALLPARVAAKARLISPTQLAGLAGLEAAQVLHRVEVRVGLGIPRP
jgi:hypothetical protein